MKNTPGIILLAAATLLVAGAQAETFGTGGNEFTLTFENISSGSNPSSGYGIVSYDYGIGTYEITADQWQKYVNVSGGPVGSGPAYDSNPYTTGNQPVNKASWFEAAQFVNWLNTSKGHQAAYSFDGSGNMSLWGTGDRSATSAFRNKDAVYVMPSEDEWVKAGYWNGTALQTYATPDDTVPVAGTDANYNGVTVSRVWNVGSGAEELNGTYDMMGNVVEWKESAYFTPDDDVNEDRVIGGGGMNSSEVGLRSSFRYNGVSYIETFDLGFRVAVIPEPSSIVMIGLASGGFLFVRRRFIG
jgi:formylglycine-generating enzyme required for sulfatase activity